MAHPRSAPMFKKQGLELSKEVFYEGSHSVQEGDYNVAQMYGHFGLMG